MEGVPYMSRDSFDPNSVDAVVAAIHTKLTHLESQLGTVIKDVDALSEKLDKFDRLKWVFIGAALSGSSILNAIWAALK